MKAALPDYDPFSANSNGFVRYLIEITGGEVDLPFNAYYSETDQYEQAYQALVNALSGTEEDEEERRSRIARENPQGIFENQVEYEIRLACMQGNPAACH